MHWPSFLRRFRSSNKPRGHYRFITSLRKLPLDAFIMAFCHQDYTGIWEGNVEPPSWEIEHTWLGLRSDYVELNGGTHLMHFIQLLGEISALASRITRIEAWIKAGRDIADEIISEQLMAEGFMLSFSDNDEAWLAQLDSIEALLGPERLKLDRLRKDLPKSDNEEDKKQASEEDFDNALLELSKYMGYDISREISTHRYCLLSAKFRKHVETVNNIIKSHGRS